LRPTERIGLALLVVVLGCGEPGPDTASSRVVVTAVVTDSISFEPLEAVDICAVDEAGDSLGCTVSEADGAVSLSLPPHTRVQVRFDVEGYYPVAGFFETEDTDIEASLEARIPSLATISLIELLAGVELEEGTGHLMFEAWEEEQVLGAAGVEVALAPQPASSHQFYATEDGGLDGDTTTTSSAGLGGIVNLPPGDYDVTYATSRSCVVNWGWATDAATALARIEADRISFLAQLCL